MLIMQSNKWMMLCNVLDTWFFVEDTLAIPDDKQSQRQSHLTVSKDVLKNLQQYKLRIEVL